MVRCKKCNRNIGSATYVSCKQCALNFHIHCVGIDDDTFDLMEKEGTCTSWKCRSCVKKSTPLVDGACSLDNIIFDNSQSIHMPSDRLQELIEVIIQNQLAGLVGRVAEMQAKIDTLCTENKQLRNEIVNLKKTVQKCVIQDTSLQTSDARASYAETLVKNSQNTIIIKPKDKTQSVNKTKSDVLINLSSVESAANISKVKNLRDGGVMLGCGDAGKIKQLTKDRLSAAYEISEVKTFRPRIRVAGFSKDINRENLLKYVVGQNQYIFDDTSEYQVSKFYPIRSSRDNLYQAIIEVDMTTYKKALGIGHCLVGLNGCSIYSAIEVTRCFTCNGFHHSSRNCKHKVICPRCSKNHDVHDCKEETLTCVNCVNLRAKENSENSELIAVDHAAWDYKNCRAHELVVDKLKKDLFGVSL
jgi:regulator of replication initiation timing